MEHQRLSPASERFDAAARPEFRQCAPRCDGACRSRGGAAIHGIWCHDIEL